MDDRTQRELEKLLRARNVRPLDPAAVQRVYGRMLARYRGPAEAAQATREALHAMAGAYIDQGELRRARRALEALRAGDADALERVLRVHASTRERPHAREIYRRFLRGERLVLDLACGLNPLALSRMGIQVLGYDMHAEVVALVNDFARAANLPIQAWTRDLLSPEPFPKADAALVMKALPLLERQEKGAAAALLKRLEVPRLLISFPTRTLAGRDVGMEEQYGEWFFRILPRRWRVEERFVVDNELCFCVAE